MTGIAIHDGSLKGYQSCDQAHVRYKKNELWLIEYDINRVNN